MPGQRKQSSDRRPGFVSRRILDYNIPKQLKSLALDVESAGRLLDFFPVLGEELSLENYCQKFKALIHLVNALQLKQNKITICVDCCQQSLNWLYHPSTQCQTFLHKKLA